MRTQKDHLLASIVALALVAVIFLSTTHAARLVLNSEIYGKSRLISRIVAQDSVGVVNIVADRRNIDMLLKFVGAITSAYIDFELIPLNEAGTFAVVFESAVDLVEIEKFSYHRKDLTIEGTAADEESYADFLQRLSESDYFENVAGHYYITTGDTIRFQIDCASKIAPTYLYIG